MKIQKLEAKIKSGICRTSDIRAYLLSEWLKPILAAEERYVELLNTPDRDPKPAVLDVRSVLVDGVYVDEAYVVSDEVDYNALRDAEIAALVERYPHLADELIERPAPVLDIAVAAELYRELIASRRYRVETGGVKYGDYTLLTDRDSVLMLDSYFDKLRRGIMSSVSWKCEGGHLVINANNMVEIEALVLGHVAEAFDAEEGLCNAIASATSVDDLPTDEQMSF